MAEGSREQKNLEEEEEEEEDGSLLNANRVNGEAAHVDLMDSGVAEEEEGEMTMDRPTAAPPAPPLEQKESCSPAQTQDSAACRSGLHVEVGPPSSSPSSPTLEERRRPGTLFIWQERERLQQQQRDKASLLKSSAKAGSHVATPPQTGSSSAGTSPENSSSQQALRQRCASAEQMSTVFPSLLVQRSHSRTDDPSSPKTSPPPGQAQKPNSFLFRTSSRSNVKPTGSAFTLGESGRSESRTTLESRLKVSLPEDLAEALSNGTVLCQLANQIRPRSVSIIHVPSPAVVSPINYPASCSFSCLSMIGPLALVGGAQTLNSNRYFQPKLSPAKCRLNVENFIAACRKLGVPETDVCVCSDVLLCKPPAVLRCVTALLAAGGAETAEDPSPRHSSSSSLLRRESSVKVCEAELLRLIGRDDSLCPPQLITEDEGLSRLAQTVQVLVDLADGSQRPPKQDWFGAPGSAQS
ncbi:hypothetical protein FQN60_017490 [Etheostoma spectabile]|uniref:Calponin-homology (CH) domain-containing protein n=1 Tax=Etheostoma spectabile TaxID=54343 RepID=A0A5J5CBM7_9PERO|nr:hypothetical protein FQN60_017490 [Etheostoma spectabile]